MSATLLQIRLFVAVYEELSFTAAAAREGMTQPGVSQHVRQLEDQLGVQLLNRLSPVDPTPAGHVYYQRCIGLLRAHSEARRTLDQFAAELAGTLHVGLAPSLTRAALAPALLAFQAAHPRVAIRITEGYGALLIEQLRRGQLDFAVAPFPALGANGLDSSPFADTPAFLVSSPTSAFRHCEPVRLAELKSLRMVLPASRNARRDGLDNYFAATGAQFAAQMELDSILGTMDLVRQGNWSTILPGLFIEPDIASRAYTLNPLVDPVLVEQMMLVEPVRCPIGAAGQAFVASLRAATDRVNALPMRLAHGDAEASGGIAQGDDLDRRSAHPAGPPT